MTYKNNNRNLNLGATMQAKPKTSEMLTEEAKEQLKVFKQG